MTDNSLSKELESKLVIDVDGDSTMAVAAAAADGENKIPEPPATDLKTMTAHSFFKIQIGDDRTIITDAKMQNETIKAIGQVLFDGKTPFMKVDFGVHNHRKGGTWGIVLACARLAKSGVKLDKRLRVVKIGMRSVDYFATSECTKMAVQSGEFMVTSTISRGGCVANVTMTHTESEAAPFSFLVEVANGALKGASRITKGPPIEDGDVFVFDDARFLPDKWIDRVLLPIVANTNVRVVVLDK